MTPAQRRIKGWQENPCKFASDLFGITLDAWQEDALLKLSGLGFRPRRRLVLKACTGPGKSALLAIVGWHRLFCYGGIGQHPKGAALSGEGFKNLKDNLWAELIKWGSRSEIIKAAFTWNNERIAAIDHPETWFLSARSYAKDADAEAIGRSLSGLHSEFPFLLLDEIGDMPIAVGQKASQIFTGGVRDGLIAAAGNPTSTDGLLYHACVTEAALWDIITITADPDDPKRTPRVDIEHAREQIKLYGRDNPWLMATILGLFPPQGFNALFGIEEVERAMGKHLKENEYNFVEKRIGVDVALYGDDRTVLFPRQGLASFMPDVLRTQEPADISAKLILKRNAFESDQEFVDDTGGWGSGVISHYRAAGYSPFAVQAAGKAPDDRYHNMRAYMWFQMHEWLKAGGALPNVPELKAELTTPRYTMKNGKFLLEPKEEIKKRLGRSPDLAEALAQTFVLPDRPKNLYGHAQPMPRAITEYDHLRDQ
jgi:phage terminase large subunit